jgi:transposase
MGKTGVSHRVMTDAERMTICMLCGQGLSYDEIGEQVKRSPATVRGVIFQARKAASAAGLNYDWRADLKEKSVQAIRAALVHDKDPYKAGGIAVQTMKGLGEFENEGQVHIATLLNSIPESQRDRYVSLDTADAIEIEGNEVPDPAPAEVPFEDEPEAEPPTVDDPEPGKEPTP